MGNEVQEFFKEFLQRNQKMGKYIPDTFKAFMGLHDSVIKDGALSKKHKELIAIGIAVSSRCKPCIYLHTQAAVQAGASVEEIFEAASVAVLMGGGPSFTHVQEITKAFEALGVAY
jgi:AhpD family alkylhydroperoxidase